MTDFVEKNLRAYSCSKQTEAIPDLKIPPPLLLGYKKAKPFESLEEEILNALQIIADIIDAYGEDFLPIFERLEQALIEERNRKATLLRAKALSKRV